MKFYFWKSKRFKQPMCSHHVKMEHGIFIVLEGIDGSGTSTQIKILEHRLKKELKQKVTVTKEPWKDKKIRDILARDKDAYSNGEELTKLFINDRADHYHNLIKQLIQEGEHILSDRYALSTYAYQSIQGVSIEYIAKMHQEREISNPDITYFLDVSFEEARSRLQKSRPKLDKLERDPEYAKKLIAQYRTLVGNSEAYLKILGPIVTINGEGYTQEVSDRIFNHLYNMMTKKPT